MDEQNQNPTKPDFGFIMNQLPPEPAPKQPFNRKPLIVFAIALLVLVIIAIFASVALRTPKTKTNSSAANPQTTVQTFLSDVASNHPEQAFTLQSSSYQQSQTLPVFTKTATTLSNNVNLAKCTVTTDTTKQNTQVAKCPMKTGTNTVTFTFTTQANSTGYEITALTWQTDGQVNKTDIK